MHTTWLRPVVRRPGTRARLLCFPYAGGGRAAFRAWPDALPADIEVWSVCLPGREDRLREPPSDDLGVYADALTSALSQAEGDWDAQPYAFFGHSFGALLSFETALGLRRRGARGPVIVTVSGHRSPHRVPGSRRPYELPRAALWAELRALWGTSDAGLGPHGGELMDLVEPVLRADLACCAGYRYTPEPPLTCAVSIFGASRDPLVPRDDLLAWRELAAGPCRARVFAGGHFYLVPQLRLLARLLAQDIAAALATGEPGRR